MNKINCDINHVVEGLEKLKNNDNYDRLHVWETECVMRGITFDEMKERSIVEYADSVAYIEKIVTDNFTFKFHQNQIDRGNTFDFRPPGYDEINHEYCTTPEELGENLNRIVEKIESEYGELIWDLVEMQAASIAGPGHLVDFEFEYEFIIC